MVDEQATGFFPPLAVPELVVDQYVTSLGMVALVARHAGDDSRSREMLGGPAHLLARGPVPARKPGENEGIEVRDRIE